LQRDAAGEAEGVERVDIDRLGAGEIGRRGDRDLDVDLLARCQDWRPLRAMESEAKARSPR
jgi:hypothetical protein